MLWIGITLGTYIVSIAFIIFVEHLESELGREPTKLQLDNPIVFLITPLITALLFVVITFLLLYEGATYFSSASRHKRALRKAKQRRELWEEEHGMTYEEALDDSDFYDGSYEALSYEPILYEERYK